MEYIECASGISGDGEPPDDIESEPRQRWKPREELLRALEEARRDLKPGEASLYWDWTRTRDSAPEAEDVRPSGEGEVLVSDKDAAAAYVAPKEVAPALAPRSSTKSRIRVRADVDPRRQPTVRTSRAEGAAIASHRVPNAHQRRTVPSGSHRLKKPVASPSSSRDARPAPARDMDGARPATKTEASPTPSDFEQPMLGSERRRRVAWAFFFGMLTGIVVFFWLRVPRDREGAPSPRPARSVSPSGSMLRFEPAHGLSPTPLLADASVDADSGPAANGRDALSPAPAADTATSASQSPATAPTQTATLGGGGVKGPGGAPRPATSSTPTSQDPTPGPSAASSFLIRKKGSPAP